MTLIDAFNLFANQYPAANMMPMNSPQTYLLQNLLAQQSMQPKQNPLLSFINRAGMAANNPGQSRIAQLIFGSNQSANPKPYAEKLGITLYLYHIFQTKTLIIN